MNASTLRNMVLSIGIAAAVLGTTCAIARAEDDHWRHDRYDRHDRDRHEHWDRDRDRDHRDRRYAPPPVVVQQAPDVTYEPPPVVVSQPPPGINIILPFNFN